MNFERSAGPAGSWKPRKDPTLTHPLLILTGAMKAATTEKAGQGHIEMARDRELTIGVSGSEIPYAATHQFGHGSYIILQKVL